MKTIMNGRDLDSLPETFRFRTESGLEVEGRVYRTAITGKDDNGHGIVSQVAPYLLLGNVGVHLDDARPTQFSIAFEGPHAKPVNPLVSRITGKGDTGTSPVRGAERDVVVNRVREWVLAFLAADPVPMSAWREDGDWRTPATAGN